MSSYELIYDGLLDALAGDWALLWAHLADLGYALLHAEVNPHGACQTHAHTHARVQHCTGGRQGAACEAHAEPRRVRPPCLARCLVGCTPGSVLCSRDDVYASLSFRVRVRVRVCVCVCVCVAAGDFLMPDGKPRTWELTFLRLTRATA
jgi:hypothetical protein